jgi:hypothetical protein
VTKILHLDLFIRETMKSKRGTLDFRIAFPLQSRSKLVRTRIILLASKTLILVLLSIRKMLKPREATILKIKLK